MCLKDHMYALESSSYPFPTRRLLEIFSFVHMGGGEKEYLGRGKLKRLSNHFILTNSIFP